MFALIPTCRATCVCLHGRQPHVWVHQVLTVRQHKKEASALSARGAHMQPTPHPPTSPVLPSSFPSVAAFSCQCMRSPSLLLCPNPMHPDCGLFAVLAHRGLKQSLWTELVETPSAGASSGGSSHPPPMQSPAMFQTSSKVTCSIPIPRSQLAGAC